MTVQKGMAFEQVAGGKGKPFQKGDPRINRTGRASSQPVRTLKRDALLTIVMTQKNPAFSRARLRSTRLTPSVLSKFEIGETDIFDPTFPFYVG